MPLLLALLLAGALAQTQATPQTATEREVADGIRQVREGDFEAAVLTLDAAVRRLAGQEGSKPLLLQAYVQLGVALVGLDQREAARGRFRDALALDPALRLGTQAFSPKVVAVFEEARQELARSQESGATPRRNRAPLLIGVGAAAVTGAALALRGGDEGVASFADGRFGARVVLCPDGGVEVPIDVSVLVDGTAASKAVTVQVATVELTVTSSPTVPSEVGVKSLRPTTAITPPTVAARSRVTVRADTTLLCTNFTGGPARFQEWSARVTLLTSAGSFSLDTSDRLRVELP